MVRIMARVLLEQHADDPLSFAQAQVNGRSPGSAMHRLWTQIAEEVRQICARED